MPPDDEHSRRHSRYEEVDDPFDPFDKLRAGKFRAGMLKADVAMLSSAHQLSDSASTARVNDPSFRLERRNLRYSPLKSDPEQVDLRSLRSGRDDGAGALSVLRHGPQ